MSEKKKIGTVTIDLFESEEDQVEFMLSVKFDESVDPDLAIVRAALSGASEICDGAGPSRIGYEQGVSVVH